jgi:DNA-binding CsgD family transcriptional regulator
MNPLSPRQREIMRMLARGMTQKEIASALRSGEPTIRTHIQRICIKLRAKSRLHAVAIWASA